MPLFLNDIYEIHSKFLNIFYYSNYFIGYLDLNEIYLIVRLKPTVNVKNGTSDLWNVQYHVANVAANIISPNPVMKNIHQKNPNTFNTFEMIINILEKSLPFQTQKII